MTSDPGGASRAGSAWGNGERAALALVLAFLFVFALRQAGSPDLGFHLATGRHILQGNGWPTTDLFSYTAAGRPWVDSSWGYDVLVAAVDSAFGVRGVVLLHAALVAATFGLVAATSRRLGAEGTATVPVLLLAGVLSEARFEARPEFLSYLLLAVALHILHRHAAGDRVRVWLLVPLFWIWANAHSLVVIGWGALAAFNLAAWARARRPDRALLLWSVAAFAVALVNPYGWRLFRMTAFVGGRLSGGDLFREQLGELESPLRTLGSEQFGFYFVPVVCLFAFIALVLWSARTWWRHRKVEHLLLAAAFIALALGMVRNAPLLAVGCAPGTAWALSRGLAGPGARRSAPRIKGAVLAATGLFCVLMGLRVVSDAYYIERRRLERFGWDWNPLRVPVHAVDHVRRAGIPGTMLNDLNYGGYLIGALRRPVYIDGRVEVYGEAHFEEYRAAFTSVEAFAATAARYGATWTIFPYRERPALLQGLAARSEWRLAYVDHDAAIFARADALPAGAIDGSARSADAPAYPPLALETVPGVAGRAREAGPARWMSGFFRRQAYPVEAYGLGVFHFLRGDWDGLAAYSAEAVRRSGGAYPELYGNLGSALYALGRLDEARECLAIAVDGTPWYRGAEKRNLSGVLAEVEAARRGSPGRGD